MRAAHREFASAWRGAGRQNMSAKRPIAISSVFGGPEYFEGATHRLIGQFSLAFPNVERDAGCWQLHLVFIVPGSISPEEGEGLCGEELRERERMLLIRAFVPPELRWTRIPQRAPLPDPNAPTARQQRQFRHFFFPCVRQAVDVAAGWFRASESSFDRTGTLQLVIDAEKHVSSQEEHEPTLFD